MSEAKREPFPARAIPFSLVLSFIVGVGRGSGPSLGRGRCLARVHLGLARMEVRMERVIAQMKKDAFAQHLGIELVEVEPGRAKVQMTVRPEHCNSVGMVHGGVIFSLADYAFAVACNSYGTVAVAINCHISYLRPPKDSRLSAEAVEVSKSRRLGSYDVKVTDGAGALVATFQGMAFRKEERLGE